MTKNGIDISEHHGVIDWEIVKGQVDFVILRCGYGKNKKEQDDLQFRYNAEACTRLNIPFGVYLYAYATTLEQAISEAEHVLRLLKGYKVSYPIYYALEDENTTGKQSNEIISTIAQTFVAMLQNNNYYVGIYANVYWWTKKLTDPLFNRYPRWIADYTNNVDFSKRFGMWQYCAIKSMEGIQGMLGVNTAYQDYPKTIKSAQYNGYQNNEDTLTKYALGDIVRFNYVFMTSDSDSSLQPYRKVGPITCVQTGTRNPYLIGKEQGWVNDQVIEGKVKYLSNPNYAGTSFSNALGQIRVDSSFVNRNKIAALNGISNYQGTSRENLSLLKLLKEGVLIS